MTERAILAAVARADIIICAALPWAKAAAATIAAIVIWRWARIGRERIRRDRGEAGRER